MWGQGASPAPPRLWGHRTLRRGSQAQGWGLVGGVTAVSSASPAPSPMVGTFLRVRELSGREHPRGQGAGSAPPPAAGGEGAMATDVGPAGGSLSPERLASPMRLQVSSSAGSLDIKGSRVPISTLSHFCRVTLRR